jgi:uncharacterized protein YfcZ (UPF0381/DUF406 family)
MSLRNETTSETISVQHEITDMHELQQIKTFSDFVRCCWAEIMKHTKQKEK